MYGNKTAKRVHYRNCSSFAVHKVTFRLVGTLGPDDRGKMEQGPVLRVFPSLDEAVRHIEKLRKQQEWPEDSTFNVTARYHDARGKVIDQAQDEFVG